MDDDAILARLAMLEAHVDWLYRTAGYPAPYGHDGTPPAAGTVASGYSAAVLDLVRSGNKIGAIKQYREETGVGLKEAKDAVERLG